MTPPISEPAAKDARHDLRRPAPHPFRHGRIVQAARAVSIQTIGKQEDTQSGAGAGQDLCGNEALQRCHVTFHVGQDPSRRSGAAGRWRKTNSAGSLAHAAAGDAGGPLRCVRGHRELQHQARARGAGGGSWRAEPLVAGPIYEQDATRGLRRSRHRGLLIPLSRGSPCPAGPEPGAIPQVELDRTPQLALIRHP
jgi:hypothetical protein